MDMRGFTQVTSKVGLIVFLAGMGIGRIVVGLVGRRHQVFPLTTTLFAASAVFMSFLFFVNLGNFTYVAILLAGVSVSALLPLLFALAGIIYSSMAGTALGIVKIAIPTGGIVFPLLLSLVSRFVSFHVSLVMFPVVSLVGLAIMIIGRRDILSRIEAG
jgi:MFS family permease